ncbi:kinase-like domain-containing protein, partial [Thamnocephalis sphaerospora]
MQSPRNLTRFWGQSPGLNPRDPSAPSSPLFAPATPPVGRAPAPSIKDYEIIKPISKGAFGSVYLAKKHATDDYYAIKVLRKSDMVAKNQVTNVKAERMILMMQRDSPYVVRLFYSFQSKDYLYLVMEYLNGGDCASLVKTLGGLTEDWARSYLAEVTLGLEYLHGLGVIHRDMKPDNLLIDQDGHLKLTDFGLSRLGFLGRRARGDTAQSGSVTAGTNTPGTPNTPIGPSFLDEISQKQQQQSEQNGGDGKSGPKAFVGTPDYLAPESILGTGQDDMVDWWALGVICYEFIYGIPPFNAGTPEKVFENILTRNICWHEEDVEVSPEARDFMERLLCSDPARRLGAQGAAEVKAHPFFKEINWETVRTETPSFVPQTDSMEDTDYFDGRGVSMQQIDDLTDKISVDDKSGAS